MPSHSPLSCLLSGWAIGDEAGDHRAKAKRWVHTLSQACGLWDEYDMEGRRRKRRKLLIVVNPKAGKGEGVATCRYG